MDHDQAKNFGDNEAEKPVVEIDIKNAITHQLYAWRKATPLKHPVSTNRTMQQKERHPS